RRVRAVLAAEPRVRAGAQYRGRRNRGGRAAPALLLPPVLGRARAPRVAPAPRCAMTPRGQLRALLRSVEFLATLDDATLDDLAALVIRDAVFDRLRERRPEVALVLLRTLSGRLADADRAIDALLAVRAVEPQAVRERQVGSIRRAWRAFVVERHRDLTFLTL